MKHYQAALELDPDDITYLNNIAGEPSTAGYAALFACPMITLTAALALAC